MTRDFQEHRLGDASPIKVLVADGDGDLRIVDLGPDQFRDAVDRELIDAVDARTDVQVVVHAPGDRRLAISPSLADTADVALGIAYVRSLLPTFAELSDRGVLVVVFAGLGPRELNAIADGRAQVNRELQEIDGEAARRVQAMLRAAQWSSGYLNHILENRIPALLPGLRVQRRRPVTIPPGTSLAALSSSAKPRAGSPTPAASRLPWPILWTAIVGTLHISYWTRAARPEDVARLHEEVARASDVAGQPIDLLLTVAPRTGISPSAARTRAAVMIAELSTRIDSVAIVLPGQGLWASAIRGMFRAIEVLVQTPIQWRAFASTDVAAQWLGKRRTDRQIQAPTPIEMLTAVAGLESRANGDQAY